MTLKERIEQTEAALQAEIGGAIAKWGIPEVVDDNGAPVDITPTLAERLIKVRGIYKVPKDSLRDLRRFEQTVLLQWMKHILAHPRRRSESEPYVNVERAERETDGGLLAAIAVQVQQAAMKQITDEEQRAQLHDLCVAEIWGNLFCYQEQCRALNQMTIANSEVGRTHYALPEIKQIEVDEDKVTVCLMLQTRPQLVHIVDNDELYVDYLILSVSEYYECIKSCQGWDELEQAIVTHERARAKARRDSEELMFMEAATDQEVIIQWAQRIQDKALKLVVDEDGYKKLAQMSSKEIFNRVAFLMARASVFARLHGDTTSQTALLACAIPDGCEYVILDPADQPAYQHLFAHECREES